MTCYENSVNTSQGKRAKLFVCARNNSSYVDVSLRGQPGDTKVIRGYIQLILEEANQYDAWVQVSSQNEGLWADSTVKDKTAELSTLIILERASCELLQKSMLMQTTNI
ncbi:hypothetical protein EYB33_11170 [Lysinibacillus sphaericus]|uniref:hypothetical protein n=1 Tax=Lysinibacillus sphaericus TaxID=1421 RepID=UPI001E5C00DC|nr:hypothetical protein [Lysinibacillus sphaericus]UDK96827.1 hypothetical protein EYB33_11170 [Lysinibacillus sphaericus]